MPEGGPGNAPFHKSSFLIYLLFVPAFLILMILLLGAMQYKQLRILVAKDPIVMDTVSASTAAEDSVEALVKGFFADSGSDTLSLSAADLNHLMRSSKVIRDLGWSYHLALEDTLLVARTSMPASSMTGPAGKVIKLFRLKGWLNSEVRLRGKYITGNRFVLDPVSAVMNGESAPATALTKQGEMDPRDWVSDKEAYDTLIKRLESTPIRGGRLLLIRKP